MFMNHLLQFLFRSILNADFACAAILISYGAVLGKTSPVQLLFMAIIETVMFVINAFICVELLGIADIGGSIVIHIFGAYFGLAFSRTVCRKTEHNDHIHEASSPISDLFSMIGTLFLWVYWPSFNAALGSDSGIGRAVINTYLGLVAATVAAFITSSWASGKNQWSMVHIQNATLAGGVAVGAVADQMIMPWGALFLGSLAGLVSTIGYIYLQPLLNQKISLHDTCGVHNLHGMPGIISALASIGTALAASETLYGQDLYVHYPLLSPPANSTAYQRLYEMDSQIAPGTGRTPRQQALCQFLGMLVTLSLSIISGALTGLGLSCSTVFEPLIRHQLFNDDTYWELPDEDETVIMTESKTSEFVEQPKIFSMKSLPDAS
ncbi:hypothetical protein SK128_018013 [Halocaridina rubra]|uniref:Ammonium transporter AmtB-like domain-containing protein n=1 Tax=Halocaridina rubra TaxID=373956 RepID=A0AAN8ZTD6_HALRR